METNNIQKNNDLIAKFMEVDFSLPYMWRPGAYCKFTSNLLAYHRSWDWLAPVLEKICRMRIGDGKTYIDYACPRTFGMLNEETGGIMVRLNGYPVYEADTLIEATYLAIIDFIKWKNGNTSNEN